MTKRMQKILLGFSLLLAVPFVAGYIVYFGYCHSWWGKDNLLFRSLWLCSCPAGFEETLYPDYVEVVFSACNEVRLFHVFPDDRYLLVDNDQSRPGMPRYFWDPLTDEKIPLNLPFEIWDPVLKTFIGNIVFLDESYYVDTRGSNKNIITLKDGKSTPYSYGNYEQIAPYLEDNFTPNPEALNRLYPVEGTKIFVQEYDSYISAILIPPPQSHITLTAILDNKEDGSWVLETLKSHGIPYQTYVTSYEFTYTTGLLSPNEQYVAKADGIYDVTNEKIFLDISEFSAGLERYTRCTNLFGCPITYEPCCWQADNQAVFYHASPTANYGFLDIWPFLKGENITFPILKIQLFNEQ